MEGNKGKWKIIACNSEAPQQESQAGKTAAPAHTTTSKEPTLRAATTDSSRAPKNPNDEMPTGGNIR